ncbi:MAG: sensor histidine kinase [Saprospiraceae bacterium]|nr:sensor histidine kinase [Saprospiraceae bacterium]
MLKKQRLFLCSKFTIGLILFMILGTISAQAMDCDDLGLEKEYTRLKKLNRSKDNHKAILLADSLLAIISKNGKSTCKLRFQIEIEKGESLELQNKFEDAMNLYYNLIRNAEPLTYWDMVAKAHISLARIQEYIDKSGDCLHHLTLANTLIQEHRLLNIESYYCVRYSSYLRSIGKDSAMFYARKAVELGHRDTNNKSISDGNLLLGVLANEVDTSIFYFKRAIDAYLSDHDYRVAAEQTNNIAMRLLKVGKMTEAMEQLAYAEQLVEQMPVKDELYYEVLGRTYRIKTTIFEKKNMIDSAYFYLKKSNENEEKSKWIIDKETVTTNAINFAIENEQEKLKTSEKISRILKVGLGVMSVLMFALGWSVFSNYSKRKKIATQNKKIYEADQKKAVLLTEIHHRVKNNLQLVISMITILSLKLKNEEQKNLLQDVSNKVYSIALIHEQLYKNSDFEHINLEGYIHEMVFNYQDLNTDHVIFETEINPTDLAVNIETVLPIGIIITELISNSLKHAKVGDQILMVNIQLKVSDTKFIMTYSDNGPGYNESILNAEKSTMGFTIIQSMVRQLQAEATRYNQHGAVFTMVFEEKKVSKI